jgi:hypothetical protein
MKPIMKSASGEARSRAIAMLVALAAAWGACGDKRDVPAQGEDPRPVTEKQAEPEPVPGTDLLGRSLTVPEEHSPTASEDRQVLAAIYLSFAEDPEGFVTKVEQLTSERRQRLADFLICAAATLHHASQAGQSGAPRQVALPPEAQELIGFEGSPERARTMFLRQLGGEFVIVGRSIQSIDRGDKKTVEQILARQKQNLEMMRIANGPDKAAEWSARIRRVFPILFAKLLPEC